MKTGLINDYMKGYSITDICSKYRVTPDFVKSAVKKTAKRRLTTIKHNAKSLKRSENGL